MKPSLEASHAIPDFVTQAMPEDDRYWVPQADKVWFRPLLLNTVNGEWVNLLKVARSGVFTRHRQSCSCPRLRHQGILALPRARLGRHRGNLRLRTSG